MDLKEVEATINVPPNAGIPGFLRTLEQILKKPRVQSIQIDARGVIHFRHYVPEDEMDTAKNFGVDFADIQPYNIVRNADVREILLQSEPIPAAIVIGYLLDRCVTEQMRPLAFATGVGTTLWSWYTNTTGAQITTTSHFFGLPVMRDDKLPDTALILCCGYGRDAAFIDTRVAYKIEIPTEQSHESSPG